MNFIKRLFIVFLSLFSLTSNAASQQPELPKNTHTQEQKAPNQKQPQSCRDYLHKVTDLDDLIRQMFQTGLFDNCLYNFQPEELQQIWEIPVLPETKGFDFRASQADVASPFNFFVQYRTFPNEKLKQFSIALNKKGYEQDGTLFPSGKFPDFLPEPSIIRNWSTYLGGARELRASTYVGKPDAEIQPKKIYYWGNNTLSDSHLDNLLVETYIGRDGVIWRLVFSKGVSGFTNQHVTEFKKSYN